MSLTKVSAGVLNIDDLYGFRNRIINGDMRIDQRNVGASVTIASAAPRFCVDRFLGDNSSSNGQVYSLQRVTDAPSGFNNSLLATVTTAGTAGTGNYQYIRQNIEGFNFADLMFGTANAQSFTLSFWVKSSITGTHAAYLGAALNNRFRVFTYTINAANTWEYKTVTIPGDTAGTWNSGNGVGLQVAWSIGCGSNFQGSPGAWSNTLLLGATGQVQLTQTLNATWQITGVQLEKGTVATPFERRPFGTELTLCQRYCEVIVAQGNNAACWPIQNGSTTNARGVYSFKVQKRAAPTFTNVAGTNWIVQNGNGNFGPGAVNIAAANPSSALIDATCTGLTSGQASIMLEGSVTTGQNMCIFTAEL
jgi:hypothetical protein